jgi:uracil-DNA glycosylase
LQAAHPIKCLETNIYSVPTERASDLAPEPWMTKPFDFLLEAVKPDLVIVHGKEAAKALLKGKKIEAKVIPFRHFSRGWSEEAARELGRVLRECAAIRGQ